MKNFATAAALLLALLLSVPQHAYARRADDSRQAIEAVIEAFRTTIIRRDVPGFLSLFLHEDITWVGVYTDGTVERHNAGLADPGAPRRIKISGGTPRKFIERIAQGPESRTETISNVRIDTDGDVAQVWFDYSFLIGDYKNNWGKESWQLVRTSDGWKIAAVTWSSEENPVQRANSRN